MDTMGIAPEAQLLIMNVSDRQGSIYFDAVLAAVEDCIILGVDCANLSLGSPCGPAYVEGISEVLTPPMKPASVWRFLPATATSVAGTASGVTIWSSPPLWIPAPLECLAPLTRP